MTRTWFITGTSSGVGLELARLVLDRGDRLIATARRDEAFAPLRAIDGGRLDTVLLDVTDTDELRARIAAAFASHGRIDAVVNNAGYGLFGAAEELTDDQLARQIATNLVAPINVVRAVLPRLREQGGGHLVQLSSMAGQMAHPWLSGYCATKWGVEGFFESLAQEVAPFGITTTLVEPGTIQTRFLGGIDIAERNPVYDGTPAGEIRRMVETGEAPELSDPVLIARAIIDSCDQPQPPRRLTLGSDAYDAVEAALVDRLDALRAQRDVAYATSVSAEPAGEVAQ